MRRVDVTGLELKESTPKESSESTADFIVVVEILPVSATEPWPSESSRMNEKKTM